MTQETQIENNKGYKVFTHKPLVQTYSGILFYGYHHELVHPYIIFVSRMTEDMSVCCNHNLVISSFMIYHWVCHNMGATCGARPGNSSEAHEFTLDFSGFLFARFLDFCVVLCRSLFALLLFLFQPLFCLSFDLRLCITTLVSSNFSYA